jgi:hypothetical protein
MLAMLAVSWRRQQVLLQQWIPFPVIFREMITWMTGEKS